MLVVMGIAAALLVVTLVTGRSPTLGLDLQGGVSVNLQPVNEAGDVISEVDTESLDEAIGIIRNRVDAVGVTEPEVSRQGNTITVQLPGATDQQDVIDLVGTTARSAVPSGVGGAATRAYRGGAWRTRGPGGGVANHVGDARGCHRGGGPGRGDRSGPGTTRSRSGQHHIRQKAPRTPTGSTCSFRSSRNWRALRASSTRS